MIPVSRLWAGWWSGVQFPVGMLYLVWSIKTASEPVWAPYLIDIHGFFPIVNLTSAWSWPLPSSAKDKINFGWNEALNEITLYPHCRHRSSHLCLGYALCVVLYTDLKHTNSFFFILVSCILCVAHCCKLRYVGYNFHFLNILYNCYCMLNLLWWCVCKVPRHSSLASTYRPYTEGVSNQRFCH